MEESAGPLNRRVWVFGVDNASVIFTDRKAFISSYSNHEIEER